MRTFRDVRLILALGALWIPACGSREKVSAKPIGTPVSITSPLGLPPLQIPADNPPTAETIALGEKLFFSPLLSMDGSLSCANCHNPKQAFTDGQRVSTGIHGKKGKRNAPSVVNAAFIQLQFWDGRAVGLEGQASGPMLNPIEMGHTLDGVEENCARDAELQAMFERAYGPGPPTMEKISNAIASFERTLISGNSPVDRYLYSGDARALSAEARRGLDVFRDPNKGNCAACHTVGEKYALFTDNLFHNIGAGLSPEGELIDLGRFTQTGRDGDQGAFRTPSLRNAALTAPYMHDGSLKTLKEVVDFYVGGGSSNPHLDKQIKPLTHLSKQERSDLVALLESLTGDAIGGVKQ